MSRRRTIVRIDAIRLVGCGFDEAGFRERLAERLGAYEGTPDRMAVDDAVRAAMQGSVRGERP
jgi:hypothetical protein